MDGYFLQECFGTIIPTRLRGGNYKKIMYGWIFFTRMFWVENPKGPVYGGLLKNHKRMFL
jgi:hypothetical protein